MVVFAPIRVVQIVRRIAGDISMAAPPATRRSLLRRHLGHVRWSSDAGYDLQLIAVAGWSSPALAALPAPNRPWSWLAPDDPLVAADQRAHPGW